ncbi:MAG TPA: hypothetical protein DDW52_15475 [Planctomycetaceae bacterium]|nr:hypothetical protein [Planctomycetaceae bacterium]
MAKNWNWWSRKLHRWGALLTAIPLLIVILSGLLLQVKKQVAWVQPPSSKGTQPGSPPGANWEAILAACQSVTETTVDTWDDIDRVDVRPGKGICKVQVKDRWEIQLDLATAEVLSVAYRRSDLIESLHDGSFFADAAKLWVFLPNGLVLLGLWITGAWLWYLPLSKRRAKRGAS